jgi:predicted Zn-dependent protease
VAVILTLLGARAIERTSVWRDEERFVAALERDAPDSYRTWWARGARAFAAGDGRAGEEAYRRAIALNPDPAIMQELGERFLAIGAWPPADRWFARAFGADSTREAAATRAVIARLRMGRADSAAALGEAALRHHPGAPVLLVSTADAWRALGSVVRALTLQRRAVFADPGEWRWQLVAAEGAAQAGRCEEAAWRARRAQGAAPAAPEPARLLSRLTFGPGCGVRS